MPLKEYREKRHFDRTAEPTGGKLGRRRPGWRFVIQKHAATRLHYDFRLEHDGVLKSWAVPNGPSLDPTQRRLAVQVEDHPLEYGDFEGIIPAGEYGGGAVLLWDSGSWSTDQDVAKALRAGKLKFRLEGRKLRGGWTLVRMRPKAGDRKENWLLIKERDNQAVPLVASDILDERPESVKSGRTIGEIAAEADKTWSSKQVNGRGKVSAEARSKDRRRRKTTAARKPGTGVRHSPFPKAIEPQLATLVDHPPNGEDWYHEIKLDGYRILAYLDDGRVTLRTRNQHDWTRRFPELVESISQLPAKQAVIDGEVVALLTNGASDFQALQTALGEQQTSRLVYYAFDLLYLDGADLRSQPLAGRKERLAELLAQHPPSRLRYSEHLTESGERIIAKSCQLGLEGIVSKRRSSQYVSGRGESWLKTKCVKRQEFVIGGFTDSTSSRKGLGALLVGYFDIQGELIYSGKVGTGFSERTQQELRERLKAREQSAKSFSTAVKDERRSTTHWVKPELVAEIKYSNWTTDGFLRQPVFQGLREDKPAREVVLERETTSRGDRMSKSRRNGSAPEKKGPRPKNASRRLTISPSQFAELKELKLTHPDRVLYPELGFTKQDLVAYYAEVSEWILPHVVNRPLSLVRCPEGQSGTCFYQKHAAVGTPTALQRVMIQEKNKTEPSLVIQNIAGLLSTVQMGVLEIHPWGARIDDIERPDRLIFDLDPDPTVAWPDVVSAAKELRERLCELGLESFPKTSGGKGLHVVLPIERRVGWGEAKQFARGIATQMAVDAPDRFVAVMSKAARRGKIFIDYLRNDRGATAVAPYSTRSRPSAPVATPLRWNEVRTAIRPDHFNVRNVLSRLASLRSDPWEEMASVRQSLTHDILRRVGVK